MMERPIKLGETHRPVVRRMEGPGGSRAHYLICAECGMVLWFVPLEELGIETSDWEALVLDTTSPVEAEAKF